MEGEDSEAFDVVALLGERNQAALALPVPNDCQRLGGERRRLVGRRLFKTPDAVVHDEVSLSDHTA
nr:hypothetical protein [Streptomyces agglomeratus]